MRRRKFKKRRFKKRGFKKRRGQMIQRGGIRL